MNLIIDVWNLTTEKAEEVYIGGFAYINLERKFINYSTNGKDWEFIKFSRIEIDRTNNHYTVYKE